jgi:hypothetical protein
MKATELLAQVKIASPCPARWEDMAGDERSRFCLQCNKHVYNLSAMSANAAADLVRAKEGKLCARFYRRADGTMLTADCPVGLERHGRRLKALCSTAAGLLLSSLGVSAWSNFVLRENDQPKGHFATLCDDAVWRVKGWFGINPPVYTVGMIVPTTPTQPPAPGGGATEAGPAKADILSDSGE